MSNSIVLHPDRSSPHRGLYLERDGRQVPVEEALEKGFVVSREDSPAALTILERYVHARDADQN